MVLETTGLLSAAFCSACKNVSRAPGVIGLDLSFVHLPASEATSHIDACSVDRNT